MTRSVKKCLSLLPMNRIPKSLISPALSYMIYNIPIKLKEQTLMLCFFVGCFVLNLPSALCVPDSQAVDYTDYLPKYRTSSTNFMISKIEYSLTKMIFHYRYVATQDADHIHFYGRDREFAWRLTNTVRTETSNINTVTRLADVVNIRVNDELRRAKLNPRSNTDIEASKGDIVTCEIHFDLMPENVRIVHLIGGDCVQKKELEFRFSANDILVKNKESNQLGMLKHMEGQVKRFYEDIGYVKYPDIKTVTTLAQQKELEEKDANSHTFKADHADPFEKHLAPIDYMPQMLIEIDDLECNERVILSDVNFHENKPEFTARGKAMKTITLVVEYLTFNPKRKIVLHGHTDIFGNAFKNLEISKQHVTTVKKALVSKGIDASRIITIHHGGSQALPRYRNGGPLNRRVEVEVVCNDSGVAEKAK